MDDRIIGAALIIIGLLLVTIFGGTMSTLDEVISYISGFLIAFAGLGVFVRYYRGSSVTNEVEN
ncbi:MAG: hypothetical protein ACXADY_13430 [Candidatus Hodarchaeales archaeon]|jgi:uncharacterized RDD family membrane protein YckC